MSRKNRDSLAETAKRVFDELPDWPEITLTLSPKDVALLVAMADVALFTLPDDDGVRILGDALDQIVAQMPELGVMLRVTCRAGRRCRRCGCRDDQACVSTTGQPCYWIEGNLCSACEGAR